MGAQSTFILYKGSLRYNVREALSVSKIIPGDRTRNHVIDWVNQLITSKLSNLFNVGNKFDSSWNKHDRSELESAKDKQILCKFINKALLLLKYVPSTLFLNIAN